MVDEASLRQQYVALFEKLRQRNWKGTAVQQSWMGWLYHITNLEHAVSILESGILLSRQLVLSRNLMLTDHADPEIIRRTRNDVKNCPRLYLRPRTPTFYHNEGFKTRAEIKSSRFDAHCPIPIAFVFDAPIILAMPNTSFSATNLASYGTETFSNIDTFATLPFDKIYHHGATADRSVIDHRQAEVIVPEELSLQSALRGLYCRSDAERATLRHAISRTNLSMYDSIIRTDSSGLLFEAKRLFVENVEILGHRAVFKLHRPRSKFEFDAQLTVDVGPDGQPNIDFYGVLNESVGTPIEIDIDPRSTGKVELALRLDNHLAYRAVHTLLTDGWSTF